MPMTKSKTASPPARNAPTTTPAPETVKDVPKSVIGWFGAVRRSFSTM